MKKFTIIKSQKGKKILYEVFDPEGIKIGQRLSCRHYIACLVCDDGVRAPFVMRYWFGRPDLIGKGDSRHCINSPGVFAVHLGLDKSSIL